MHIHLRQDSLLKFQCELLSKQFCRAVVMPNTIPPINSAKALLQYEEEIKQFTPGFTPLMTFKIASDMDEKAILALKQAGAVGGKYYPKGVTTNSEDGLSDWKALDRVFKIMENAGLVLSIHGEDPNAFCTQREESFIPVFFAIRKKYKNLKIVFEHVSTKKGVQAVLKAGKNTAATVTVHHLKYTLDDVLGAGLNPHMFCKPLLGNKADQDAIRNQVFSGNPKFFFGSDSAPHLKKDKLEKGAAGIFSLPVALPLLADEFEKNADFKKLEDFTSKFGALFYGLKLNSQFIEIEKEQWKVPDETGGVVPLEAGRMLDWKIKE